MCDMSVNADFHADFMLNYQQKLVPLLHDGIRVMIYVGMEVSSKPSRFVGVECVKIYVGMEVNSI